jgi:hypothetical protein
MKKQTILELQGSEDYVILNNPLASPKFIRTVGAKKGKSIETTDIYTPKLFYEIASKLTPEHLAQIKVNESVVLGLSIKNFLESIGANIKNYRYLIDSVKALKSCGLEWRNDKEKVETGVNVITKYKHFEKEGRIDLFIDSEVAQKILEVKENNNFSFLKANTHRLDTAHALRLYPFFKSWVNHKVYQTDLVRFKKQFGYNTSGYRFWNNFEERVLKPAMEEINDKTDIHISYEPTGTNLDGQRPRVRGLKFRIDKKKDIKILPPKSPTPGQPHQVTTPPQKTDSISVLYSLILKIPIQEKPTELTVKALLESMINGIGYQATKDGLLGMIDSKAKAKSIAFFTPDNLLKYPNFEQAQQAQAHKVQQKKQEQQEEIKRQRTSEEIKRIYVQERTKYLKKVYDDLSEQQQQTALTEIWENSTAKGVYFRNSDKQQPNTYAIENIAKKFAFPDGYNEQEHLKKFAFKNWDMQINFSESGEIILN